MRRILVAVDESDASVRAAAFVNDFFGGLDVEVIGIHVGQVPVSWVPPGVAVGSVFAWPYPALTNPPGDRIDDQQVLDSAVQEGEQAIRRSGLDDDEDVVEFGDPADAISTTAVERDVDLIVVGSNHRNALQRLWSGSVSSELQKDAPRPVLIVH